MNRRYLNPLTRSVDTRSATTLSNCKSSNKLEDIKLPEILVTNQSD